jgi:hypothetical protein
MTGLTMALAAGALVCYGANSLYAAWIDGRRKKERKQAQPPAVEENGDTVAEERNDGRADD